MHKRVFAVVESKHSFTTDLHPLYMSDVISLEQTVWPRRLSMQEGLRAAPVHRKAPAHNVAHITTDHSRCSSLFLVLVPLFR